MAEETDRPAPSDDDLRYELLLYGHEQVLRGSDTAVLAAFAALAYQGLKDNNQPHHLLGFGFLLLSVLLCTLVHFAIGRVFLRRARRQSPEEHRPQSRRLPGQVATRLAWLTGGMQLICVVVGIILVLLPNPPEFLKDWFGW